MLDAFEGIPREREEVYLLHYNGDEHNATTRANQEDVAMHMQQSFGQRRNAG